MITLCKLINSCFWSQYMHTVLILFKLFDTKMINLFRGIIISISHAYNLLKRQECVFSDVKYYHIGCFLLSSRFSLRYIPTIKNELPVFPLIVLCTLLGGNTMHCVIISRNSELHRKCRRI